MDLLDERVSENLLQIEASPQRATDMEKAYLYGQLHASEVGLQTLNTELGILLAKRSHVIKHINRCRTLLAPYSKLPGELIEEIVRYCVGEPRSLPLSKGQKDPRLQITQICSSWRSVAFGIDGLWNIHIERLPKRGTLNLISAWFNQCSSARLAFTMSEDLKVSSSYNPDPIVYTLIVPYAHRFRSLGSLIPGVGRLSSLPFDVLSELSFRFDKPYMEFPGKITAPVLRGLEVTHIRYRNRPKLLQQLPEIPWEQLTSLSLVGMLGIGDVYQVLTHCTLLQRCTLHNVYSDSPGTFPYASLRLSHLEELEIQFNSQELFHRLFLFNVPILSSLSVSLPPATREILNQFITFLATLSPTLRDFGILGNSTLMDPIMEIILRTIPFTTRFHSKQQPISPAILSKIGTGHILPAIEVLELHGPESNYVEGTLDFISGDAIPASWSLREVYLYTNRWSSLSLLDRVEDLYYQGISVFVLDPQTFRDPAESGVEIPGWLRLDQSALFRGGGGSAIEMLNASVAT